MESRRRRRPRRRRSEGSEFPAQVPIQRRARGVLSRRRFQRIKKEVYIAVLAISRCYRGYAGRRDRNKTLYGRESADLQNLLRLLASEAEQMTDRATRTEKRMVRRDLKSKKEAARSRVDELSDLVVTTESRYMLLIAEKDKLTPRAIASGYRGGVEFSISVR